MLYDNYEKIVEDYLAMKKPNKLLLSSIIDKITIDENKNVDLVPCRRMPIVVGNLLEDNMYHLYKKSNIL